MYYLIGGFFGFFVAFGLSYSLAYWNRGYIYNLFIIAMIVVQAVIVSGVITLMNSGSSGGGACYLIATLVGIILGMREKRQLISERKTSRE